MNVAMSIWVSWPARVAASDDRMRFFVELAVSSACWPRHCVDWYVLQAVATAATARRTVAAISTRCWRASSPATSAEHVHGAGDDEPDHRQRDQRLNHHRQLRPAREGQDVGRAEGGVRGQAEDEVVDVVRAPARRGELG